MKTNIIKTAMILGFTFTSIVSQANTATSANETKPGPEKTISNSFKFPTLLIPYSADKVNAPVKVEVVFTADKDGKITYANAKTRDLKLKQEIEKQFSLFKVSSLKEKVAYSVVLNFKYIGS